MDKKQARLRRARKTRIRILKLNMMRFCVNRTNSHIFAQIIDDSCANVLVSASTQEAEVRAELSNGGDISAAAIIGRRIAEKAKVAGIVSVAFDRSGFKYHGRVRVLADAARENGLIF